MPYTLQLPNGKTVQVPDHIPPEQARVKMMQAFPTLFPKRDTGLLPAAKSGLRRGLASLDEAIGTGLEKMGVEAGANYRSRAEELRESADSIHVPVTKEEVEQASGMEKFSKWVDRNVTEPIGGSLGAIVPSAAGAATGALVGGPAGAAMGARIGFASPYMGQMTGENIERQREINPDGDVDMLNATAAGLAQTALGMAFWPKALTGSTGVAFAEREAAKLAPKILRGELTKEAAVRQIGSRAKLAAKEMGTMGALGIGTEVAEEVVRRGQAGQSVVGEEATDDYIETVRQAAPLSLLLGGLHGSRARGQGAKVIDRELQRWKQEQTAGPDRRTSQFDFLPEGVAQDRRWSPEKEAEEQARIVQDQRVQRKLARAQEKRMKQATQQAAQQAQGSPQRDLFIEPDPLAAQQAELPLRSPEEVAAGQAQIEAEARKPETALEIERRIAEATGEAVDEAPGQSLPSPEEMAQVTTGASQNLAPQVESQTASQEPVALTSRETYAGAIPPRAAILQPARGLVGRDLTDPKALGEVITLLQDWGDLHSKAENRPRLSELLDQFHAQYQTLTGQPYEYDAGSKPRRGRKTDATTKTAVPPRIDSGRGGVSTPTAQGVEHVELQENRNQHQPDAGRDQPVLGSDGAGLADTRPPAEAGRGGNGPIDGAVREDAAGEGTNVVALNPQPTEHVQQAEPAQVISLESAPNEEAAASPDPAVASEAPAAVPRRSRAQEQADEAESDQEIYDGLTKAVDFIKDAPDTAHLREYLPALRNITLPKTAEIAKYTDAPTVANVAAMADLIQARTVGDLRKLHKKAAAQIAQAKKQYTANRRDPDAVPQEEQIVHESVRAEAEKGDGQRMLAAIERTTRNPLYRSLSRALMKMNVDVKTSVQKMPKGLERSLGLQLATNELVFNADAPLSEHTALHEYVHAATVWAYNHPQLLNAAQRDAVYRIDAIFDFLQQDPQITKHYGMTNPVEMIAEAFTDPAFQQALKKHTMPRSMSARNLFKNMSNMWDAFVDSIRRLLGLTDPNEVTALEEILDASAQLMDGSKANRSAGLIRDQIGMLSGRLDEVQVLSPRAVNKRLKDYPDATAPKPEGSVLTKLARKAGNVKQTGVKKSYETWKDAFIQSYANSMWGFERLVPFMEWSERVGGRVKATALAKMQHASYAIQLGKESLSMGGVAMDKEGLWRVYEDKNNLRDLHQLIEKLPVDDGVNPFAYFNGLMTNLSYHERETKLESDKKRATKDKAKAKLDLARATTLAEEAAAKKRLAEAERVLDTSYKRPKVVTDQAIQQALKEAQDPAVKKVLDMVRKINHQNILAMEQGGLISAETAKQWRDNKYYVPLQRTFEEDPEYAKPMRGTLGGARTGKIHGFEGSERDVEDIVTNLMEQRMRVTDWAMRNEANLSALSVLEAQGVGGVKRFDSRPNGDNVVTVKENGDNVYFKIEDELAFRTFNGLTYQPPAFMRLIENFTHAFRELIMLSPDAIVRNMTRDVQETWIYNYTDRWLGGAGKDIVSEFGKGLPQLAKAAVSKNFQLPRAEISVYGITGEREHTTAQRERARAITQAVRRINGSDVESWASRADQTFAAIYHSWQNVATQAELASRNHIYQQVLQRTGSTTEATMAAINLLDFRRRGDAPIITYAKMMIPFINSQIQGIYKIYRALKGDNKGMGVDSARRAIGLKFAQMAMVATAYTLLASEDDEYMQIDKSIRDNNVMIPTGVPGMWIKFPLPFEFGSASFSIPQNLILSMRGKQDFEEFKIGMMNILHHHTIMPIPQFVKPVLEAGFNYDTFTGGEIVPHHMKSWDVREQQRESTTELAKGLSEITGISPIKVDHMIRGYLGSIGQIAVTMTDKMLEDEATKLEKPWHRYPVMKSIFTDPTRTQSTNDFYRLRDAAAKVKLTASKMEKEGRVTDIRNYLDRSTEGIPNKLLFALYSDLDKYGDQLAELRRMRRLISQQPNMDKGRKERIAERLKKLESKITGDIMPRLEAVLEKHK